MKRLTWAGVLLGLAAGCDGGTRVRDAGPAVSGQVPVASTARPAAGTMWTTASAQGATPARMPALSRLPDGDPKDAGQDIQGFSRSQRSGMTTLPAVDPPSAATSTGSGLKPVAARTAHASRPTPREETGPSLGKLPPVEVAPEKQPAGLAVRLVSGKRLRIDFAVKGSPGEAPAVELWCTRDGKTWTIDPGPPQRRSPYVMEVKEEGLYGLTLVACNDAPSGRPEPGDLPQFWVAVDWTRPVVGLMGVEVNGARKQLSVRWSAADANLGPRPITLSYAPSLSGPWTTLAANLRNNGHYDGPLPRALPGHFYVRVEAADQVGNVGEAHSTTPVALDASLSPHEHGPQIQKVDSTEE
jgi:hypothetical protein